MKSKKKPLVAATISAFLALAGSVVAAQGTGGSTGSKEPRTTSGKKAIKERKGHKGGKRGHKGGKKGHKGGKKGKKSSGGSTTPPPK